ncbi:MAG: AbrB/MazE/SpoVT family DNA-binding domain-containing protein [Flavobacterium sp.]|nr:MAG: AbrB/MazE/SpoVT family DNA-binding domain-containing protein [Flavobacterium sp.]
MKNEKKSSIEKPVAKVLHEPAAAYLRETQIVKIRQIGNSRGLIIPNNLINKVGIKSEVIIGSKDGVIFIEPLNREPREGWTEAFKAMRNNNDDELLLPDMFNDEDIEAYD